MFVMGFVWIIGLELCLLILVMDVKSILMWFTVVFEVDGFEEFGDDSWHLVVPVYCIEQPFTFHLDLSGLQLFDDSLYPYLPALTFSYSHLQHIILILFNWPLVPDMQIISGNIILTVQHSQVPHVLIDDGSSGPTVLDFRMPTDILGRTENAIKMLNLLIGMREFILAQIGGVVIEPPDLGVHPVVVEALQHQSDRFQHTDNIPLL